MLNINNHDRLDAQTAVLLTVEQAAKTLSSDDTSSSGKKTETIQDVLAALSQLLSDVQGQTANLQGERGQMNAHLQQLLAQNLQQAADKIASEIEQAEQAQANQSTLEKIINGFMVAIGAIITIFAPEVGLPMLLVAVANLTGLTDKVSTAITDAFEKMGMSQEVAEMVSQLIIFTVVTAGSFLSSVGSDTSLVAGLVKTAASLGQGLITAPQLFSSIATVALTDSNLSDDEKKQKEQELALAQGILGALLMISSGGAQFFSSACREVGAAGSFGSNILTKLGKIGQRFSETALGSMIQSFARTTQEMVSSLLSTGAETVSSFIPKSIKKFLDPIMASLASTLAQLTSSAVTSGINYQTAQSLAITQESIGNNEAALILSQTEMKMMNNNTQSDIQSFSQRLQNQSKMMASIIGYIETEGQSYLDAASNF